MRLPWEANERSTASTILTTSTPSSAEESGVPPLRMELQKSVSSMHSGSDASMCGDTIEPVRYVSLYSP